MIKPTKFMVHLNGAVASMYLAVAVGYAITQQWGWVAFFGIFAVLWFGFSWYALGTYRLEVEVRRLRDMHAQRDKAAPS